MKILLATFWIYPHLHGVNTYISLLRKALEQQGHEVDILAHNANLKGIYLISNDSKLNGKTVVKSKILDFISPVIVDYFQKHLPHVDSWVHWQEIERFTFELAASLFDLHHYDIIHTQDIISTQAISRVKPSHVPLVTTIHGLLAKEMIVNEDAASENSILAQKWWNYLTLKEYIGVMSADQIIIPSKWLAKQFSTEDIGVPYDRINIIPYGMDISSFLQRMNDEPSPSIIEKANDKQFVISCPARLVKLKGHQTLIDSLCIVKESRNDFVCWFIGDGELENHLKQYANEKGLSKHIFFMGERKDVPSLLNNSDIVVLPSLQDNLPFAIMEAQVAGKPVVASNVGGIPEMITHGKTGLLFEVGNKQQLAECMLELMGDEALCERLKTNVTISSKLNWSIKGLYEHTMEIYEQALESEKTSTRKRITKVNLDGKYGLINEGIKKDNVESIFAFENNIVLYTKIWRKIIKNLPEDYSIPETVIIKTLADMIEEIT